VSNLLFNLTKKDKAVYIGLESTGFNCSFDYEKFVDFNDDIFNNNYNIWYIDNKMKDENLIFDIIDLNPKLIILGDIKISYEIFKELMLYAKIKNVQLLGPYSDGLYQHSDYIGTINPNMFKNNTGHSIISSNRYLPYMIEKELSWYNIGLSYCITLGRGENLCTTYKNSLQELINLKGCSSIILHLDLNNFIDFDIAEYIKENAMKHIVVLITGRNKFSHRSYNFVKKFRENNIDICLDITEVVNLIKKTI